MTGRRDWLVLGGWVAALVIFRSARQTERDPYWQAREGIERWNGSPLARPDSWSYALPDGIFRPTSPAWNSALAFGHEVLSVAGIALAGGLGMLGYFAVALLIARRLGGRPLPSLVATATVALLALPMLSPRATIVIEALLLSVLLLGHGLVTARLPAGWRSGVGVVAAGAFLGWLGAWVHVSWSVTAIGLAVALPALALLSRAPRRHLGIVVTLGLSLVAGTAFGPYGLSVWQLLLDVSSASNGQVVEWLSPFTPGLRARWLPVAALCLLLAGACALRLMRTARGATSPTARSRWALSVVLVAISLVAALAGLVAIRFLGVAALTLLPVLASELSAATVRWRAAPGLSTAVRTRLSAAYWRPILAGTVAILMPLALFSSRDPGRPDREAQLAGDLPRGCRLFADPDTAGAVLLLRPDVEVWIDMRTEVHGSQAYGDVRRRLTRDATVPLPERTTCALLPSTVRAVQVDGDVDTPWLRLRSTPELTLWTPA